MLTRSHRIFSIALIEFGLAATNNLQINPGSSFIMLLGTGVGASLPDIDEYNSSVSRKSIINFSLFLRHRGITHSLIGFLIFSGGIYFLMSLLMPIRFTSWNLPDYWSSLWLGLTIGYFLHLLDDSFSKRGVNWLTPFRKKCHGPKLHYKVGGPFEKLIVFIAIILIIILTIYWLWLLSLPDLKV